MSTAAETSKGRVLVVDDEPAILNACTRALERAGYETVAANSGENALEHLRVGSFDAVLTDIQLGSMDGVALLRTIRQRDLDAPVILMTGAASIESAVEAVTLGAFRYLTKPLTPADVVACVGEAVNMGRLARTKRAAIELLGDGGGLLGDRVSLTAAFERALGTLWMAFQPIVDWRRQTIYGYEALVRTKEPAIPHPGALFDAAERLGAVQLLGRRIRDAVPTASPDAPPDALFFVNLHSLDLLDETLYSADSALTQIASRTVLEITERATLDEVKDVRGRIRELKAMGFRIAIDDLGAGYAGLNSFAALEPDIVKLDMSLIRDVDTSEVKAKIVRAMVGICRDLGMKIVAEGIETAGERDKLRELDCDLFQGYFFAKPSAPFPTVSW
jgi:EAL domain-containing protein (putative c-di-GMP-specific phosphodiesterase class I)/ActR/RegA family two-component response regulator